MDYSNTKLTDEDLAILNESLDAETTEDVDTVVDQGLKDAEEGKLTSRGSFAEELEDEKPDIAEDSKKPEDETDDTDSKYAEQYGMSIEEIKQARDAGWAPKEEFKSDPDLWENPKRFLKTKEIFSKMEEKNKAIKELKEGFDNYKKHLDALTKKELEQAKKEIENSLQKAKEDGDFEAYADNKAKLDEMSKEIESSKGPADVSPEQESLLKHENRIKQLFNDDFEQSKVKLAKFLVFQEKIVKEYKDKGLTIDDLSDIIVEESEKNFSDWLRTPKKKVPPASAELPRQSPKTSAGQKAGLKAKLSPKQWKEYQTFKEYYELDEYIADLQKMGQL